MSIGRKIELALALIIVLTIGGLYGYGQWQSSRRAAAQENYQVASGDAKAYKVMAAGTKRIAEQEQRVHEELDEALEANRDWAAEPVPYDVAVLLCHGGDASCVADREAARDPAESRDADEWGRGEAGR